MDYPIPSDPTTSAAAMPPMPQPGGADLGMGMPPGGGDPTGGMGAPPPASPDAMLPAGEPPGTPPRSDVPYCPCDGKTKVNDSDCAAIGGVVYKDAKGKDVCVVCPPGEYCPVPPGLTPSTSGGGGDSGSTDPMAGF